MQMVIMKECRPFLGNGKGMSKRLRETLEKRLFSPEKEGKVREKTLKMIIPSLFFLKILIVYLITINSINRIPAVPID